MVKVGVVSLVTLSVPEAPVSEAVARSGRPVGAPGGVESITRLGARAAEAIPRSVPNTRLEVMFE